LKSNRFAWTAKSLCETILSNNENNENNNNKQKKEKKQFVLEEFILKTLSLISQSDKMQIEELNNNNNNNNNDDDNNNKDEIKSQSQITTEVQNSRKSLIGSNEDDKCIICFVSTANTALIECGHMSYCENCSKLLKECPICRKVVVRTVRIFKS